MIGCLEIGLVEEGEVVGVSQIIVRDVESAPGVQIGHGFGPTVTRAVTRVEDGLIRQQILDRCRLETIARDAQVATSQGIQRSFHGGRSRYVVAHHQDILSSRGPEAPISL